MNFLEEKLKNDVSIDRFLLDIGVPESVIEQAKNELMKEKDKSNFNMFVDKTEEHEQVIEVPLRDIYEPARADSHHDKSWYYVLNGLFFNKNHNYDMHYDKERFSEIFRIFDEKNATYQEMKEAFEKNPSSFNSFDFNRYVDKSGKSYYFQSTDGSHRLVVAKLIGVKNVFSKRINDITINWENLEKYKEMMLLKSDIINFVDKSKNFSIMNDNFIQVDINDSDVKVMLCDITTPNPMGQNGPLKEIEIVNDIKKLSMIKSFIYELEEYLNKKSYSFYEYLPSFILNYLVASKLKENQIDTILPYNEREEKSFDEVTFYKRINLYAAYANKKK